MRSMVEGACGGPLRRAALATSPVFPGEEPINSGDYAARKNRLALSHSSFFCVSGLRLFHARMFDTVSGN
jgi:hypothetical protein